MGEKNNKIVLSNTDKLASVAEDYASYAKEYLKMCNININSEKAPMFINLCKIMSLNPFKREIYYYEHKAGHAIIVGYETYIKRAERSGVLNGWASEVNNDTAKVTIYRKDWEYPFVWEIKISEYKKDNPFWREKPLTMGRKVCIAQAFRMAFPEECGGLPYTFDEITDEQQAPQWDIDRIKAVISDELKSLCSVAQITSSELVSLFIEKSGNQKEIIKEIKSQLYESTPLQETDAVEPEIQEQEQTLDKKLKKIKKGIENV